MADNLLIDEGSSKAVASEDISSVWYSKVKLIDATATSTSPTGVAANPFQVSIANTGANSTAVKVDGSAATQPVSGTVTANLSATDNAVLDAIAADTSTIAGDTTSIDGKITACNTGAVVVSSSALPTGAATAANQSTIAGHVDGIETLLGTIDTDTGSISTSASTIAGAVSGTEMQVDVVTIPGVVGTVADDATTPGAPVMTGGQAISPDGTDPGRVSAEADVARFRTDLNRRQLVNTAHPQSLKKHLDGSSAYTDEVIAAAPGANLQIVITSITVSKGATSAFNFFLEEGASKIFGPIYLEETTVGGFTKSGMHLPITANTAVTLTTSAAIAQSADFEYFIQAV